MLKKIAPIVCGLLLYSATSNATIVTGSFYGSVTPDTGSGDIVGSVFGAADLSGNDVAGTYTIDTSLLSSNVSGSANTLTGTFGALTVSVSINGNAYTFTDQTNSQILLDDSSGEIELSSSNNSDAFYLDASFGAGAFGSNDPTQTLSLSSPISSTGTLQVGNDPNNQTYVDFTLNPTGISLSQSTESVPEPASFSVLLLALGGMGALGSRRTRKI